jgi:hypothetical protein
LAIPNPVIGESALPNFSLSTKYAAEGMRGSAFDELNRMFERHVFGGSK